MIIAPSILAADFAVLREQIQVVEEAGADWLHLDVMDGHFVPNISFGPLVVETVRKVSELPLDVHLMIEEPDRYIEAFRKAGADCITVHVEACPHLHRTVEHIKSNGAKAGVALNPATPISLLEDIVSEVELILVMSVNPGFGGQKFIPAAVNKVARAQRLVQKAGKPVLIEVDGGIDAVTAREVVPAGANVLVAGSSIFGAADIAAALKEIRAAVA
ncbi:MAG: ribulose-phosphate 3-epimerase [Calditrichaeota bacterium]|nr:MAG: ribulose-phosphate 3-epimerase [Calditrichota bacterium]